MSELAEIRYYVAQDSLEAAGEGTWVAAKANKMGFPIVMDFYTQMALEGRVYQVRAGTVTTHLTGDVEVSDTKAEMAADPPLGRTILPVYLNVHVEALGGTVPIIAAKSVATCSTAGAAFVPLPLYRGGVACTSTARVAAAGGVTVTAELATTTLRHYSATLATADMIYEWEPRTPPIVNGAGCFYVQVAAAATGPNYYANFDFIELPTTNIS